MRVVESYAERRSPLKSLGVGEVRGVGVLGEDWNRTERAGRFRVVLVKLQGAGKSRIEAGDRGADAQG